MSSSKKVRILPAQNGLRNESDACAARVDKPGPPDVIVVEDIDLPAPGEREVLVCVSAAGVGPWDVLVRTGKSGLPQTYPVTLGSEISGVVEKLGSNTDVFAVGAEVFGATNSLFINGYAENMRSPL
jgi:NADPH:quinone reductase-like Zn-dependent oxidoreductase